MTALCATESVPVAPLPRPIEQFIPIYAVTIRSPDGLIFLAPVAHQIGAHEHVGTARIAGNKMTSADVKEPRRVA
jgi:hypothetical protein